MDKPKCRYCGHKHWSSEPHVFSEKSSQEGDEAPESDKVGEVDVSASPNPGKVSVVSKETGQVERNKRYREKHPDRYREYMRNYMREYRQRAK